MSSYQGERNYTQFHFWARHNDGLRLGWVRKFQREQIIAHKAKKLIKYQQAMGRRTL